MKPFFFLQKPEIRPNFREELGDSSQSELSDIAEVEEEEMDETHGLDLAALSDVDRTPVATPIHMVR